MTKKNSEFATELFFRINEEKRERILSAIVEEFAGRGFANANVNNIAKRAGISVGALYKYFPTKDDLYMYIIEASSQIIEDYVIGILEEDIRFLSKIEKLLRLAQDYSKHEPDLIKLYNVFSAENDTEQAQMIAARIESITSSAYRKLIKNAQENNEIRDDIDAGILAFMLDNQLMAMQFSFACAYYDKRYSLFLGERNSKDNEYVINNMMKVIEGMFGVKS